MVTADEGMCIQEHIYIYIYIYIYMTLMLLQDPSQSFA